MAIRNLLKDRFKLVTHTETREMPVYNLVLARNDGRLGPALKESSAECQAAMKALLRGRPHAGRPAGAAGGSPRCVSSQPGIGTFGIQGRSQWARS